MSLYKFYGNSSFKIGMTVKTSIGAGLDSDKVATVIPHFNWREEEGAYKPPSKTDIPIQFENKTKRYFPSNYLTVKHETYNWYNNC